VPKQEMVPARGPSHGKYGWCKPEWDLLCWTRRELGQGDLAGVAVGALAGWVGGNKNGSRE